MTKTEMQRFLNVQAEDGKSVYEAMQKLMDLLGLNYPAPDDKKEK